MLGGTKAISPCVMREEHVGKAAPGLAHRVGAEWRGAHALNAAAHVSNELDAAAARRFDSDTLRRSVAVSLSWSWSHQPQGRA